MTRETVHARGSRYLVEGRLTVRQLDRHGVVAIVRDDSGLLYRAEWTTDLGWLCNCPAPSNECGHLAALRLITAVSEVSQ